MSDQEVLRIVGDVEIGKLQLAPGDVLVVKVEQRLTAEQCVRLRDHLRSIVPDVQCLIVQPGIELSVLTRAEIEAKAA